MYQHNRSLIKFAILWLEYKDHKQNLNSINNLYDSHHQQLRGEFKWRSEKVNEKQ